MIQRILNKCTTAVTIVLDGKDVTIPAGELSSEYKEARFSFADQRLINACLLVPIESRDKLPMAGSNDLRQPSPKTVVDSYASDRTSGDGTVWSDKKIGSDGPVSAVSQNEIKPTDKKTKSKTDK